MFHVLSSLHLLTQKFYFLFFLAFDLTENECLSFLHILFLLLLTKMYVVNLCFTVHIVQHDMNYIMTQIEKQDGVQSIDREEVIKMLWNKRELAYKQLKQYDIHFQALQVHASNPVDGLKVIVVKLLF